MREFLALGRDLKVAHVMLKHLKTLVKKSQNTANNVLLIRLFFSVIFQVAGINEDNFVATSLLEEDDGEVLFNKIFLNRKSHEKDAIFRCISISLS